AIVVVISVESPVIGDIALTYGRLVIAERLLELIACEGAVAEKEICRRLGLRLVQQRATNPFPGVDSTHGKEAKAAGEVPGGGQRRRRRTSIQKAKSFEVVIGGLVGLDQQES